jgi:hypothetical protein
MLYFHSLFISEAPTLKTSPPPFTPWLDYISSTSRSGKSPSPKLRHTWAICLVTLNMTRLLQKPNSSFSSRVCHLFKMSSNPKFLTWISNDSRECEFLVFFCLTLQHVRDALLWAVSEKDEVLIRNVW